MTTIDKPMRPLRDIDTNEHFTFSSSLHGAAAEISRALIDSRIGRGFRVITG
jgi:hypothetical protein